MNNKKIIENMILVINTRHNRILIALLLLSLFLIFFRLGKSDLGYFRQNRYVGSLPQDLTWVTVRNPFFKSPMHYHYQNYHEYRYSTVVQGILETNNWFKLTTHDPAGIMNYYQKGPIYFWLAALTSKLVGFSKLSVRLPAAIFGFLCVIAVYLLADEIFDKKTALWSVFILITTFQFLHVDGVRAMAIDSTFAFFIIAAVYGICKQEKNVLLFYWASALIGLASLTRSVLMVIPCVVSFFMLDFFIVFRSMPLKDILKKWVTGLIIILMLFLPWVTTQYLMDRKGFIGAIKEYQIKEEFRSKIKLHIKGLAEKFQYNLFMDNKPTDLTFYPWTIFKGFFPWSMLAPLGMLYNFHIIKQSKNRKCAIPFLVVILILAFLYLKVQKWARYMIDIYPFLAIIVGKLASDFYQLKEDRLLKWGILGIFFLFWPVIVPYNINCTWVNIAFYLLIFSSAAIYVLLPVKEMFIRRLMAGVILVHFGIIAFSNILQGYFIS